MQRHQSYFQLLNDLCPEFVPADVVVECVVVVLDSGFHLSIHIDEGEFSHRHLDVGCIQSGIVIRRQGPEEYSYGLIQTVVLQLVDAGSVLHDFPLFVYGLPQLLQLDTNIGDCCPSLGRI